MAEHTAASTEGEMLSAVTICGYETRYHLRIWKAVESPDIEHAFGTVPQIGE